MGTIIELPEEVVKKIAAGEVVERPASVVKELVENSIDAQANVITIEIMDGGVKEIKVVDNGIGMSREDAILACKRHTTSKIRTADDLKNIKTLGFRGEALASIAAVSKTTIITRRKDDEIGTKVTVEGGVIKNVEPIGCNVGTTVIVRDLFYNVPVRRKFLKSPATEFEHIADVVARYSFLYLYVHFKLKHNGRTIIASPATSNLIDKVSYIYGTNVARSLIQVNEEKGNLRIIGVASKPNLSRSTRDYITTFVNGRYVINQVLYRAVDEAYFTLLPEKRYPIVIFNLEIPPNEVDVNIHPSKREIRFHNPEEVYNFVRDSIRNALLRERLQPEISEKLKSELATEIKAFQEEPSSVLTAKALETNKSKAKMIKQTTLEEISGLEEIKKKRKYRIPWKILGQVGNVFIVATDGENIFIIDQHAAHERIQFERLLREYYKDRIRSQELLEPYVLDFPPQKIEPLKNILSFLKSIGIDIDFFGGNTFLVRAVPVIIKRFVDKETIRDFIDDLLNFEEIKKGKLPNERDVIALMACRSAIKAGDALSHEQMEKLIYDLFSTTENPYTCPHGRPTILELRKEKLYKLFKRT
ncbi:MAG: DNA mismatch repair endonuclease MutL [Candidatus Asgardarchaeia archaeon]